jgi:hypothetical protein
VDILCLCEVNIIPTIISVNDEYPRCAKTER